MVMAKNAMRRNLRQSIKNSFGRYAAISAIIALGAGLFIGLLMSKTDMVATGQAYIDEQNMFDVRMVSNYGWTKEYVEKFAALDGVEEAEGLIYMDLIAREGDADEQVYRFYSMPDKMNRISLRGGRMPEHANECLADGYQVDESILGKKVVISRTNDEDNLNGILFKEYTVVGYVASPLYMDMNRGTTSIGSGSLKNYYYIPKGAFHVDYYTEIDLTMPGSGQIYTDAYNDAVDAFIDAIEPQAEQFSQERYDTLMAEIEEEYDEGYRKYQNGLQDYQEGKEEAEQELADALQELEDGEQELADAKEEMRKAARHIELGRQSLGQGWVEYNQKKAAFDQQKPGALAQISSAMSALTPQMEAAQTACSNAQREVNNLQSLVDTAGTEEEKAIYQGQLDAAKAALVQAQQGAATLQGYYDQLVSQKQELANAEAALESGRATLEQTEQTLHNAQNKLWIARGQWDDAREELDEGWAEYEDAKEEVAQELAEAEADLAEAEQELKDARQEIDDMEAPDLIILDRTSNVGYNNLDSSSDIVQGVSRVFPVFFLLIASLVCITTMTRMIDEERTQIGTLKALGYSNGAIISKYLIYSGSGAVLGCTVGAVLGCTIFPKIIWHAYKIMLYITPDVVLRVNWVLVFVVEACYLAVMLAVTWYCCARTLREEPAELIRPKAPDAGKKILLEYLPLWQKLSFLNKVAIRNIFRYRQRLAMMLVGIGGCTALLIAGFGLRDSIVNVVDYQFENVTHYDVSVYFRDTLTARQQERLAEVMDQMSQDSMLYHQSSVDLSYNDRTKEIYMISGDENMARFIDLHQGEVPLSLPGQGEVVLSVGVAEMLGIHQGDRITLRNGDMQQLDLLVSGIYDNHIYNYALVAPQTIEAQWGELPELQMAFARAAEGVEVHALSAALTDLDFVLNVSISEDLAGMVSNMMKALDLVVVVIVLCAGLLAVVVLYNLTNINITERIREIATIKVLGFNAGETASYVFKENLVLTVAGSVLGLGMGWLLLQFIMDQVKIDMVWFHAVLTPASCVWAVALTLLSALGVVFIFYFKLDKINMAEALKSVE